MMSGRFTLYQKPDGGMHLSYLPDGGEPQEVDLPAALITAGKMAAENGMNPLQMLGKMGSIMRGGKRG
jgi:hypothetical protein